LDPKISAEQLLPPIAGVGNIHYFVELPSQFLEPIASETVNSAYRKSLDIDPLRKDVWRYLSDALKVIGDEHGADDAYIKAGLSPPRFDGLFG
jgi:hypothetical protein